MTIFKLKMNYKILNRVIEKTKIPNLIELLAGRISLGELHSLLLKVFKLKTKKHNVTKKNIYCLPTIS